MYQHYASKRYHKPEGRVNTQVSHKTETLGEILIASARIAQIHSYACAENTRKTCIWLILPAKCCSLSF